MSRKGTMPFFSKTFLLWSLAETTTEKSWQPGQKKQRKSRKSQSRRRKTTLSIWQQILTRKKTEERSSLHQTVTQWPSVKSLRTKMFHLIATMNMLLRVVISIDNVKKTRRSLTTKLSMSSTLMWDNFNRSHCSKGSLGMPTILRRRHRARQLNRATFRTLLLSILFLWTKMRFTKVTTWRELWHLTTTTRSTTTMCRWTRFTPTNSAEPTTLRIIWRRERLRCLTCQSCSTKITKSLLLAIHRCR